MVTTFCLTFSIVLELHALIVRFPLNFAENIEKVKQLSLIFIYIFFVLLVMSLNPFVKLMRSTFILPPDQLIVTICVLAMISVTILFVFVV